MRKYWIGLIVVIAAIALGVAAAWGVVSLNNNRLAALATDQQENISPGTCAENGFQGQVFRNWNMPGQRGRSYHQTDGLPFQNPGRDRRDSSNKPGPMMRPWDQNDDLPFQNPGREQQDGSNMPGPMMRPWNNSNTPEDGERINLDQASTKAEVYLSGLDNKNNLKVAEVMEFEHNFYIAVVEKATSRGAFELLVDPYSGAVFSEPGPNMMWNLKYGHMRFQATDVQNSVSLAEAKQLAQQALEKKNSGANIEGMGLEFYGYYTFDYEINGQIAGMLSINGSDGSVWVHTWHGKFITEKEL